MHTYLGDRMWVARCEAGATGRSDMGGVNLMDVVTNCIELHLY